MRIFYFLILLLVSIPLSSQNNSVIKKHKHTRIERDSLIGEFITNPNYNTGVINLYADSIAIVSGLPGCYSCFVLDDCGKWRIKRKFLIIESFPKDNLLESKFLNDSFITIINTQGGKGTIVSYKNGKYSFSSFNEKGLIKILKKEVDSIVIGNLGYVCTIYSKTGEHDYYKFNLYPRCLPVRTRYKYRISRNYNLTGKLSGKKVKLIKNSNMPDNLRIY